MSLSRYTKKFFSIPAKEKILFLRAYLLMIWYRIVLMFSSYKNISDRLKSKTGKNTDQQYAKLVRSAILRASKVTRAKNLCLLQVFSAKKLLNSKNIDSTASIGIRKHESEFLAHAWLESSGITIIPKETEHNELHNF